MTFDEIVRLAFDEVVQRAQAGDLPSDPHQLRRLLNISRALDGRSVAHVLVAKGALPAGFDAWEIATPSGWSVAHEAAYHKCLPSTFDRLTMATSSGWTVAHVLAERGDLPPEFDQWTTSNHHGWTIAHAAAMYGCLPSDFNQWGLADKKGHTVLDAAREAGNAKTLAQYEAWHLHREMAETIATPVVSRLARSSL